MRRENTFKIDCSQFTVKPSVEKLFDFCRTVLGLKREDIKRLQCHRGGACAFVKVANLSLAQKVVDEHDAKHEVEISEGKKIKLRLSLEDGSVEVRVHDLPEDVVKEKIVDFLSMFGDVISVREVLWGESDDDNGIPLGIWSARMIVKRNIDSWVTIDGEQAFVTYRGQLHTCRHCKEQAHTGISCVQNKKLLFQKSYANVTRHTGQSHRSTTGRQPRKAADTKLTGTRSVGQKSTATPPLLSSEAFPALISVTSQDETLSSNTSSNNDLASVVVPPKTLRTQTPSKLSSFLAPPQPVIAMVDMFRKPTSRSGHPKSKSGNGNESEDSSPSTSSKGSRKSQVSKKARREKLPRGVENGTEEEEGMDL
jgi:hypothetical protein